MKLTDIIRTRAYEIYRQIQINKSHGQKCINEMLVLNMTYEEFSHLFKEEDSKMDPNAASKIHKIYDLNIYQVKDKTVICSKEIYEALFK